MYNAEEKKEIETYIYKRTEAVDNDNIIKFLENFDISKFKNIKGIEYIKIETNKNHLELIFNDFNYYINKKNNEFIRIKNTDLNLIYTIDTINKIKNAINDK